MNTFQLPQKHGDEQGSLAKLLLDAAQGAVFAVIEMIEYLAVWFVCYPVLFFGSVFLLHVFYQSPLENASLDFWANLMLTLGAVFFFGHRLLTKFITVDHKSPEYAANRSVIRFEVLLFIAVNFVSYYTMKIPVMRLIDREPLVRIGFVVFYLIFVPGMLMVKSYYNKYMR